MKGGTRTARSFTAQRVLLLCAALALVFAVVCVATVNAATVDADADAAEDVEAYSRSFSYETDADADAAADAAQDVAADAASAAADAEADAADEEPAQALVEMGERAHAVAEEATSAPTRVHRRRHTDADDDAAERRAMGQDDADAADTDADADADAAPQRRRRHRAAPKHAAAAHRKPMPPPAPAAAHHTAHAAAAGADMRFAKVDASVAVEAPPAVRIKDPDMSFFKQHIAFATWTFGLLVTAFTLGGCLVGFLIQRFCKAAAKTSSGEYGRAYQPVGDNL